MHEFVPTEDGSVTLYVPELNEHYHSIHGAIQEAQHIFIRAGFDYRLDTCRNPESLHILEAGFGTGLNAYLTLLHATERQIPVHYHTLEKYPLSQEEINRLNYNALTGGSHVSLFETIHAAPWEEEKQLTPFFHICKHKCDFRELEMPPIFDIVYFDAFNPDVQPHLWTADVFSRFYSALRPDGILVTYCVKGIVKQALRSVGFNIRRLPGPPGKREMLRASKNPQPQENCLQ